MRILFLCPYVPLPSQGGGGTCNYYFARNLSRTSEVHLLCLERGKAENVDLLRPFCRTIEVLPLAKIESLLNCLLALFSGRPFRLAYYDSREFARLVRKFTSEQKFDVILASNERMGQYVEDPSGSIRVMDFQDVVSHRHRLLAGQTRNPFKKLVHTLEAKRLAQYEVGCLNRFDSVWVTTQDEADRLQVADRRERLRVILRGIDLEHFSFGLDNAGSHSLIFTGHMSYEPNVDGILHYLREIHGRVQQLLPESRLQVVGNYPHRSIRKAARGRPEVIVTGPVKSMPDYLRRAKVLIVPLRIGTGVRIKILEAMAVGLPVVSTSIGCAGIGTVPGEHLLVADDPDGFARAVKRLFDDRDLYQRLSRNGRKFVEEHYDLNLAAAEIEAALGELMRGRETPRTRTSDIRS